MHTSISFLTFVYNLLSPCLRTSIDLSKSPSFLPLSFPINSFCQIRCFVVLKYSFFPSTIKVSSIKRCLTCCLCTQCYVQHIPGGDTYYLPADAKVENTYLWFQKDWILSSCPFYLHSNVCGEAACYNKSTILRDKVSTNYYPDLVTFFSFF